MHNAAKLKLISRFTTFRLFSGKFRKSSAARNPVFSVIHPPWAHFSDHAMLAQAIVHLMFMGIAEACIADPLDLAPDTELAARSDDEIGHSIHCKWQQGRNSQNTKADPQPAPRRPMHQISDQKPGRCPENQRCRHRASLYPQWSRVIMLICHGEIANRDMRLRQHQIFPLRDHFQSSPDLSSSYAGHRCQLLKTPTHSF